MSAGMHRPTVLIVDDDRINRAALAEALQDDCRLLLAKDGETALQRLKSDDVSLVLLDISMPGMDGYQVLKQIRTDPELGDLGVIFITGQSSEEDEERGLLLGAADYITKPVRPAIVRARVNIHLKLAAQRRELEDQFGLTGNRLDQHLARLHRMDLVDMAPSGRLRARTRKAVRWRPGGPMSIAFEKTVKRFFIAMDFGAEESRYVSDMVQLSMAGRARVQALFEALREDIQLVCQQDSGEQQLPNFGEAGRGSARHARLFIDDRGKAAQLGFLAVAAMHIIMAASNIERDFSHCALH